MPYGLAPVTQAAAGMSRDDSGTFLGPYQEAEVLKKPAPAKKAGKR